MSRKIFSTILIVMVGAFLISFEALSATSTRTTVKSENLVKSKSALEVKLEGKSVVYGAEKESGQQTTVRRLRLEPILNYAGWTYELRIDINYKKKPGKDSDQELENIRLEFWPEPVEWGSGISSYPLFQLYAPTNSADVDNDGYKGGAGIGYEVKTKGKNLKSKSYAVYIRESHAPDDLSDFDGIASEKLKTSFQVKYSLFKEWSLVSRFKYNFGFNKEGLREEKYRWRQGVEYKVAKDFNVEVGHEIDKAVHSLAGSESAFSFYDPLFSGAYTRFSATF